MKECIFCHKIKEDNQFNKEHILLEALGGKGSENMIDCVCITCNSAMGETIDANFVNTDIIKYIRFSLKIKGKGGIPNPFKGYKVNYDNTFIKGELITNKEGEISAFRADYHADTEKGIYISPKKDLVKYVNGKRKEMKLPPFEEQYIKAHTLSFKAPKIPHINDITISEIKPLEIYSCPVFFKMAYELCFKILGKNYLKDPIAININKFLYCIYNEKKLDNLCCPTSISIDFKDNITKPSNILSISLYALDGKIYSDINLYELLKAKICVSETLDIYKDFKNYILKISV